MERDVTFIIKRFDGEREFWQEFKFKARKGMTVLEGLYLIKEEMDGSLAFRSSCRMGVCGSCAVKINGKPKLACETQIFDAGDVVELEPLDNMQVLKDLVVDMTEFFRKHQAVKPYLIRRDVSYENPKELYQKPEELHAYYNFALCIKCGACYSACPASATRNDYLGPAALTSAYRFCADSRDEGKKERISLVSGSEGIWRCHFNAECSEVCPKNVEPAKAIQKMRIESAINLIKSLFR